MAKNKTEQEIRTELHQKKTEDFLTAYNEAYEAHITPINTKFEKRLIPVILSNKVGGLNPGYGIEEYKPEPPKEPAK